MDRLRIEGTVDYKRGHQARLAQFKKIEDKLKIVNTEVASTKAHINSISMNSKAVETAVYDLRAAR